MEAPHHDALTHQALRGIALMSTESIQPNCSNNAAWNDPSAGMGLRLLALLGSVVLTLFNPQVRIDLTQHLGIDPLLAEIIKNRLREAGVE